MSTSHGMASADAAWLHMDRPTNLMVINSVLWCDEPIDWDRCRDVFRERLVEPFDRFRQRPVETTTGPHWEDVDVDLDLHLHHVALPAPGDRRALQDFVSDRVPEPLDRSRPLWEAYLVDGLGNGAAVLIRMHHSIADGISLARVMLELTDGAVPSAQPFRDAGGRSAVAAVTRGNGTVAHLGGTTARHPRHAAATVIDDAQTLAKLLLPGGDPRSAIKGDQRPAHRVAWSDPLDLWRVKRTARALGTTVNDVLVSAVAGAVGRQDDMPDEVHALVPFNLRPLDEPLPRTLGNRFGLVILGLPVGIADPLDRTLEVKRRMDAIKHGHEGAITYGILELMGHTPPFVEGRLIDYFSGKGSMVLTNVPGPRRPLSLAGTPLAGVLVWAPCSGSVGMSVSIFSYAGKVTVGFLTDAGIVPDPQRLADGARAEALAIGRAARDASVPPGGTRRRRTTESSTVVSGWRRAVDAIASGHDQS
jgi:WS/DGAT/MGAT family acyltransferase